MSFGDDMRLDAPGEASAAFLTGYAAGRPQIVAHRLIDDLNTPLGALLKCGAARPGTILLESGSGGESRGRYSILALDPVAAFRIHRDRFEMSASGGLEDGDFAPVTGPAAGPDPLAALRTESQREFDRPPGLPPAAAGLFGFFAYDIVRRVEALPDQAADPLDTPEALFVRPGIVAIFDTLTQEIIVTAPVLPRMDVDGPGAFASARARIAQFCARLRAPEPADLHPHPGEPPAQKSEPASNRSRAEYHAMVARARDYITAGDIFQVVPSQRFSLAFAPPAIALYRSLRRINPSPYLYFLNMGGFAIVGASPEILVSVRAGTVTIRPIAGTAKRGASPAEDAAIEAQLLADPKERAEHIMLLDLGRNDVGRVARPGSVRVTESFTIERYSHVMHVVSNVVGEIATGRDTFEALLAGFPAGTVSGAPKVRAMQIIAELEPHKRGIYGGGIGYFGAGGDMDFAIALRTAVVRDGVMSIQAGGGVVLDSDPEGEYQESNNKAAAMFRAAADAWRFA